MVVTLIRMRLSLLAHSVSGLRAMTLALALLGGVCVAAAAMWFVLADTTSPRTAADMLALLFGLWTLGWLIGPVFLGGSGGTLVPGYFATLPLGPRRLSIGLFAASLIGVGPLVTLAVFAAGGAVGARMGPAALAVAVPATALQVVLIMAGSRVVADAVGAAITSTARAVVSALPWAVAGAVAAQSWLLLPRLADPGGLDPTLAASLRRLPSGWGLAAIESAARGDWPAVVASFGALALGCVGLLTASSRLTRRRTSQPAVTVSAGAPRRRATSRIRMPWGPVGAVVVKELRTMLRDLDRALLLSFAVCFALAVALVPLLVGETIYLAGAGVILALLAPIGAAQLYAGDGTALWTTLMVPQAERPDVRGRQLAWLLAIAPPAILATVVGGLIAGERWTWPWALSLLPAALGAGAGLVVLTSVYALLPVADPRIRARDAAGGDGTLGLVAWAMLPLVVLAVAPAAALPLLGTLLGDAVIQWLGVPAGLVLGWSAWSVLGRVASDRLESRGPELLQRMRSAPAAGGPLGWKRDRSRPPAEAAARPMPLGAAVASWTLYLGGFALVVTQTAVAAIVAAADPHARSWFLALHLPEPARMPGLVVLGLTGLAGIAAAIRLSHRHDAVARRRYRLP
jgi:ABC-2 type transport system permease protein